MSSKHTPGPWMLHGTAKPGAYLQVVGTGGRQGATTPAGRIAEVAYIPQEWGSHEANAALIAAAPELLAACEEAVELIEAVDDPRNPASIYGSTWRVLRAAITKARGES